jgi:hypothetical protein
MTARLTQIWLAMLLALTTVGAVPATSLAAAPAAQSRPTVTGSLPWVAVAFAGIHRDPHGHVDAAFAGLIAVVAQAENRVKGQMDPLALATLNLPKVEVESSNLVSRVPPPRAGFGR